MFYSDPHATLARQKFHNLPFDGHHKFTGINTPIFLADASWILNSNLSFLSFLSLHPIPISFYSFFAHSPLFLFPSNPYSGISVSPFIHFLSFVSSTPRFKLFPFGYSFPFSFVFHSSCRISLSFNLIDPVEFTATTFSPLFRSFSSR